jgi:hypothetical protein
VTLMQWLGIYGAVGLLMAVVGMYATNRKGWPTRGETLSQLFLWTMLGPFVLILIAISSPVWLPRFILNEFAAGRKFYSRIARWFSKPILGNR